MTCKKSVTKFDKAAGREITTCEKFDGAADGELGTFAFAPSGLHWGWGAGAGLAASIIAGQLGASGLFGGTTDASGIAVAPDDPTRAKYAAYLGIGVPFGVGAVMAFFRRTRTAAWAMMGAGLVGGVAQYFMAGSGKYIMLKGGMDRDLSGMIAARQMAGAGAGGVQVLSLPVAKQLRGAGAKAPVQIMGGTDGANAPVEVLQGGFGASFGTNFSKT